MSGYDMTTEANRRLALSVRLRDCETDPLDVVRELLAVRDRIIAESVEGSGVVTCDTCGAESDQPSKAAGIAWLSRHAGEGCA